MGVLRTSMQYRWHRSGRRRYPYLEINSTVDRVAREGIEEVAEEA
jgi:hypothetical protein